MSNRLRVRLSMGPETTLIPMRNWYSSHPYLKGEVNLCHLQDLSRLASYSCFLDNQFHPRLTALLFQKRVVSPGSKKSKERMAPRPRNDGDEEVPHLMHGPFPAVRVKLEFPEDEHFCDNSAGPFGDAVLSTLLLKPGGRRRRQTRSTYSDKQRLLNRQRRRLALSFETQEEYERRLAENAERARQRRKMELPEARAYRLAIGARRMRRRRLSETPEEAQRRKQIQAERMRRKRMAETPEETQRRRATQAQRARLRRLAETPQQAARRRAAQAERTRLARLMETAKEAERRKKIQAERTRVKRLSETVEQRQQRLAAQAERMRLKRLAATFKAVLL